MARPSFVVAAPPNDPDGVDIFVYAPDRESRWGFALYDDDQTFDGGFGCGEWEFAAPDDPRITAEDHDRLDWVLEQLHEEYDPDDDPDER